MLFWRAGALDSNETWWEGGKKKRRGAEGGSTLDTSVIRSALREGKRERDGERVCVVVSPVLYRYSDTWKNEGVFAA